MTTRRDTLFNKLKSASGFDANYSPPNRQWFIGAVLDASLAATPAKTDPQIEADVRDVITAANTIAKAERNFTVSVQLEPKLEKLERKDISRRVEAIYGVIGLNSALVSPAAAPLRQFLLKRRYHGVVRMVYHVNPNSNGYMRYPAECPQWRDMRLNKDARPFWNQVSTASTVPLQISQGVDPETAVFAIWEKTYPNAPCDGNLLDCANGTGCVLVETLFEAAKSDDLLKAIVQRGPRHLLVINPSLRLPKQPSGFEPHLLFDTPTEPKKMFTQHLVEEKDFQVGDYLYLVNHGLYRSVAPTGVWSGEHALVTNCGNRKPGDGAGFLYNGHGLDKPQTVESLYDDLVKDLQTRLHRTFKIADMFFTFRKTPGTVPTSQWKVDILSIKLDPNDPAETAVHAYLFSNTVKFNNYISPPKNGSPPAVTDGGTGFPIVIFDVPDKNFIAIAPPAKANTVAEQLKQRTRMIFLRRPATIPAGSSPYEKTLWTIPYRDTETFTDKEFALFGGPGGTFKMFTRSDMPKNKFGRSNPTQTGAEVTRPNADSSPAYRQFLTASGAIP